MKPADHRAQTLADAILAGMYPVQVQTQLVPLRQAQMQVPVRC